DIFSLGCVIAEVFCDGKALFDLSALLSYRRGDAAADLASGGALAAVDPDIRRLVLHMIQLDPAARWPAAKYLSDWPEPLFPPYFSSVLHPFFASLLPLDADARVAATAAAFPRLRREILAAAAAVTPSSAAEKAAAATAAPAGSTGLADGMTAQPLQPPATSRQQQDGATGTAVSAVAAAVVSAAAAPPPPSGNSGSGGMLVSGAAAGGVGSGTAGLWSLLDEVGALLADNGSMVRRFKVREPWGNWQGASSDDDMALLGCAVGGAGGGRAGGDGGGGGSSSSAWRGREEVELPRGGGWQWAGEWTVDMRGGQPHGGGPAAAAATTLLVDADGWEYRSTT
ncbi:hypothetical protein VOLCADRAFT_101426, partial [Volvox carteri f. nagariensis]